MLGYGSSCSGSRITAVLRQLVRAVASWWLLVIATYATDQGRPASTISCRWHVAAPMRWSTSGRLTMRATALEGLGYGHR